MQPRSRRPFALIILDGWFDPGGSGPNLLSQAHTPNYSELCGQFPRSSLAASGQQVGLAGEEPGNAEAGHLTIGAGRILMADSVRVGNAVAANEFSANPVIKHAFTKAAEIGQKVHFIGLLSDAGKDSHQEALFALLRTARSVGISKAFVHCILDGLDVRPRTADVYVEALEVKMAEIGLGRIASLCGRFYAMDSRENWERTARAFTMLVHGEGERAFDPITAIRASYLRGISDEFITPIVIERAFDEQVATVANGDLVVFFNHAAEGIRQLARSLSVSDAGAAKGKVDTVCLTEYDPELKLPVAFRSDHPRYPLAEVLSLNGVRNYRITESARAEHVTEILNGRQHGFSEFEERIIIQAGNSTSLESEPESKSFKIADRAIQAIEEDRESVFVVNFPAADLVAGVAGPDRVIESAQYIDTCLGGLLSQIKKYGGAAIITSSHAGLFSPHGSGSTDLRPGDNKVPIHYFDPNRTSGLRFRQEGTLQDVAPTLLSLMGIEKPAEMTGRSLLID